VQLEDRFTPVVTAAGKVLAIEGVIDRARCPVRSEKIPLREDGADVQTDHQRLIHHLN
jgi:hypothetical protein